MRTFVGARDTFAIERSHVNGGTVAYRRSTREPAREHPAVVVLPGAGLSGRYLLPLAEQLAHDFPVWVPDPPGAGASDAPAAGINVPAIAAAIDDWMATIGLDDVVVVANSMGCQLATELAATYPDRVARLVLQGQTVDRVGRSVPRQLARVARDAFREPVSLWFLQLSDWIRTGPRRAIAAVRAMFAYRIEDRLPLVRCPTLVVSGGRDAIAPPRWSSEVRHLIGDRASLTVVGDGAHAMPYSCPAELARLVREFVVT